MDKDIISDLIEQINQKNLSNNLFYLAKEPLPLVGVIAAYEARNSLWTISRQIPVVMLTMTPMMMVCRLTQNSIGLGYSLALGWIVFLILLVTVTRFMWSSVNIIESQ